MPEERKARAEGHRSKWVQLTPMKKKNYTAPQKNIFMSLTPLKLFFGSAPEENDLYVGIYLLK